MVEEHYHEAAGTSYTDAHASGFEVLPDDVVIKSYLQRRDPSEGFEVKPCNVRSLYMHIIISPSNMHMTHHSEQIASFPGPAQLSVTCSMHAGRAWEQG